MRSTALLAVSFLALTGCVADYSVPEATTQTDGGAIRGVIHGGQQAVQGSHVYVFAVGTGGYGGQSTSLLTNVPGVTTADTTTFSGQTIYYVTSGPSAGGGQFNITGDYTCTAGTQVYLYATSGSSDGGTDTNNGIGMMAPLGNCPASGSLADQVPYVTINEVSTIATAYALAGFAIDSTHISSSGTALAQTGVANAMANALNVLNVSAGTARTSTAATGSVGTVPSAAMYTLANILAACINTATSASTNCTTLLGAATSTGVTSGTKPTETATAAINIAHYPGANISTLYSLTSSSAPFASALSSQPNDFVLGVTYLGGGLNEAGSMAMDAAGNVWLGNQGGKSLSKFSPLGVVLSGSTGLTGGGIGTPWSVGIDQSGNVWGVNIAATAAPTSNFFKFSNAGVAISDTAGYTGGGLNNPNNMAVDASGNVWAANYLKAGGGLAEFSNAGVAISTSAGYTGGGMKGSLGLGIDGAGAVWTPNYDGSSLSKFTNAGVAVSSTSGYTGGGISGPDTLAIDSSGNVWLGNTGNNSLSKFSNKGVAISSSAGFTGGGLNDPSVVGVDGDGNVLVANYVSNGNISKFTNAGVAISGSTGYKGSGVLSPWTMAIDGSGNVWVSNYDSNTLTQMLGLAAPVITPVVAGLSTTLTSDGSSKLGTRP
ncbi:MAG: NHL repeat-containing protein [Acidobacteriaceae bacterium]|nr:NHL repeat-containing protein [Acidobacteriaceae bacterium]